MPFDFDSVWKDDLLGRRSDAAFLVTFLNNRVHERRAAGRPASYVLNLDAEWGRGKSFFLKRLADHLREDTYLVAEVNAWKDDHAEDPLLSVMAAVDEVVASHATFSDQAKSAWDRAKRAGAEVALATAKGAGWHLLKKLVGDGAEAGLAAWEASGELGIDSAVDAAVDELKPLVDERAAALLAGFKETQRSIGAFRSSLSAFLGTMPSATNRAPLFILVDELDRCRPTYAISLIERMKHLFDIDDVIFVVATDTAQLQHAIRSVYGQGFDSRRYLTKFFDRTYTFTDPDLSDLMRVLISSYALDQKKVSVPPFTDIVSYLSGTFFRYGLSLREVEQCYDLLRSVVTTWASAAPLELAVLVPMIVGYYRNIEPSLTHEYQRMLEEIEPSRAGLHRVQLYKSTGRDSLEDYSCSVDDLFGIFVSMAAGPLPSVYEHQGSPSTFWVKERLSQEFQAAHQRTHTIDGPRSLMHRYGDAIRTAGRLTP
ncbi:P-loop NTPase fold protein [Devosia sp.]|uniref:KAP family P-loop NTPase fold protein n=1 Tax=Devosia sp. TaxID=1871048 RepID=UPI001B1FA10C|nr:P-loop NTPase fold protein [Devosia sp.]MBO9589444.1 hypothetical protein [Devosia sp.]